MLGVASLAGAASASAETVFSDGFESGDFSAWSQVQTSGGGTAAVQNATVRTGALAARLAESSNAGSRAYVRKTFNARQDLSARGDFQVRHQGASGGNVPFFRFLDPSSARIVSVYRQNATSGKIGVTYGGRHFTTTGSLRHKTWGRIELHVITNGAASTVEVRLNGTLIYQTTSASLGTAGVSTVQIGNDTAAQAFTIIADTIDVEGAPPPLMSPFNASAPRISGALRHGQTLTAHPGRWSGTKPIGYAYRWRRCNRKGANCSAIPGATGPSYVASGADVGRTLRVAVTATNSAGSATAGSKATKKVRSAPPRLVALWHMDELSGTVMRDSIRHHDGSLRFVQLGLPGFSGTAYGFNGSNSYVSVPSASDLNPRRKRMVVSARLKTRSAPARPDWDLIRKGLHSTPGGEYLMEYQPGGRASCAFQGSVRRAQLIARPSLDDGHWHTIKCVKTRSAIKVVVDGRKFSKAVRVGRIANAARVTIGARPGSEFFKGSLDEAKIKIG